MICKEKLELDCLVSGPDKVNTYIVGCKLTGQAVIIDPGGRPEPVLDVLNSKGLKAMMILNTHGHGDHVAGNKALKQALDIPVAMHADDDDFFRDPKMRPEFERLLGYPCGQPADIRLADGINIRLGNLEMRVIHTPGHTPGSVCYLCCGNLFTGDTLFVGDVGRTDLPGGSLDRLLVSLEERIIPLDGQTKIWPGHDYGPRPTSTLAQEMEQNPYITDFILAD